jgi:hypothetical protein
MAKGQKRSNKEIRKPKTAAKKDKSAATAKEFLVPPSKKK